MTKEEAISFIICYLQKQLTDKEEELFIKWLQASEENKIIYEKIRTFWMTVQEEIQKKVDINLKWEKFLKELKDSSS